MDVTEGLVRGQKVDATCYRLHGKVEIADWYDATGNWISLRGKATDVYRLSAA